VGGPHPIYKFPSDSQKNKIFANLMDSWWTSFRLQNCNPDDTSFGLQIKKLYESNEDL